MRSSGLDRRTAPLTRTRQPPGKVSSRTILSLGSVFFLPLQSIINVSLVSPTMRPEHLYPACVASTIWADRPTSSWRRMLYGVITFPPKRPL